MAGIKQKLFITGFVAGGLLVQIAASANYATKPSHAVTDKPKPVASETLSWAEAQQRKYGQTEQQDSQAVVLTDEQSTKLITLMRLMTLDL